MEHQLTLTARIKKHLWYYTSFIILQLVGFLFVLSLSNNKTLQLDFIILTTGIYVMWSLLHQYLHHKLSVKIATEYILIGLFGLTVTYFIL